jgi:hypothetical protein
MSTTTPFFITGCPRSGTTLLQVMLNRHPSIVIPPELKLFFLYYRCPQWVKRSTIDRISGELSIDSLVYNDTVETIYEKIVDHFGACHCRPFFLGDKTPEYAYRLEWIDQVFPGSRWVFMVRDPRDVVASLTSVPWLRFNDWGAASLWSKTQARLWNAAKRWPDRIHWLRFEDLVQEPEHELGQLLEFLGIPSDSHVLRRMLACNSNDQNAFPSRETWKQRALGPLDHRRVSAWTEESKEMAGIVESICHDDMSKVGYQSSTSGSWKVRWRSSLSLLKTLAEVPSSVWFSELAYRLDCNRWRKFGNSEP